MKFMVKFSDKLWKKIKDNDLLSNEQSYTISVKQNLIACDTVTYRKPELTKAIVASLKKKTATYVNAYMLRQHSSDCNCLNKYSFCVNMSKKVKGAFGKTQVVSVNGIVTVQQLVD